MYTTYTNLLKLYLFVANVDLIYKYLVLDKNIIANLLKCSFGKHNKQTQKISTTF